MEHVALLIRRRKHLGVCVRAHSILQAICELPGANRQGFDAALLAYDRSTSGLMCVWGGAP